MMARPLWLAVLALSLCGAADKYDGPRPAKPDTLYLVHADNLVETEVGEARQQTRKDDTVYTIPGASSPARTPLAEPIFLVETQKLDPSKLMLYRLEVKGGVREITFSQKKKKGGARALRLSMKQLDEHLYQIEAAQLLENGEYSLSPADSNQVFCFQVY